MSHKPPFDLLIRAIALLGKCQMFIRFLPDEHIGKDKILHELNDFDKLASKMITDKNIGGDND
jgi:hypothetical protein